jgi:hypothetical protein
MAVSGSAAKDGAQRALLLRVGQEIQALPWDAPLNSRPSGVHAGAEREGKEGLRSSRQHIVHHHRCDRATARDVSNPPAGLQDQHAALKIGILTERPGKYKHAVPSHALRQYATLTGDKADCSDTLLTDHSPCR